MKWWKNKTLGVIPVGSLITFSNDTAALSTHPDDVHGVATVFPSGLRSLAILLFHWHDKYRKDVWGNIMTKPDIVNDQPVIVPVLNPDYQPDKKYVPRSHRCNEWTYVALGGGVFPARVDGFTVEPGNYVDAGVVSGIGTRSLCRTNMLALKKIKNFDVETGYAIMKCLLR